MSALRFLGGATVEDRSGGVTGLTARRHPVALLALLATAPSRTLSRGKLVGLLWPESPEETARNRLSTYIHLVRNELGDAALVSVGDDLRLAQEVLTCDVCQFENALAEGNHERAVELYKGPFLDGFRLGSWVFDEWVDQQRERLRRDYGRALESLAERAEELLQPEVAAEWWRRRADEDPYDSRVIRRWMEALAKADNRAEALRVAEAHARRLQAEFGTEPSDELRALVEELKEAPLQDRRELDAGEEAQSPFEPGTDRTSPGNAKGVRRVTDRSWALWGALGAAAVAAGLAFLFWDRHEGRSGEAAPVRAEVVAVLPFRVGGADPTLHYLREGMVDLLAARLNGEGGIRAADPRSVMSAWRRSIGSSAGELPPDAALELARELGAGQLLLGSIVGTPNGLVLNASLTSVPEARERVEASVEGPADSLTVLVDRLAARLLALEVGETGRLAALTSASLPALRAYLEGQAAYRKGRYQEAVDHYDRALDLDSTFALAALNQLAAAPWLGAVDQPTRARAWALRDRLGKRDRALLTAYVGPRFPGLSSMAELLAASQEALQAAPDRPELWYQVGDYLFHDGPALGISDAHERAAAYFHRAVNLDRTFAAPLSHLTELAVLAGDTAEARRLGQRYLALDSVGDVADYIRWRVARTLGDEAALAGLRRGFSRIGRQSLIRILGYAVHDGRGLGDAELAAAALRSRALTRSEREVVYWTLHDFELNRGRPSAALAAAEKWGEVESRPRAHLQALVLAALYSDGDPAAAARAAERLARYADASLAAARDERACQYFDICALEQWRLWRGDTTTAARSIARLRSAAPPADSATVVSINRFCASVLETLLAAVARHPDASAKIARLDSLTSAGPLGRPCWDCFVPGNLVVSRLHAEQGNFEGALLAVRRRIYHWDQPFLSSYLRHEARLAARVGDRDGAIRAYRHYLALRADAEPALQPQVDRVRAELQSLLEER